MPLSSSPSTQRRRVGGRGMLVNSIHGVDTLRYVVVHSGLSYTCFTEVLSSYAIIYRLSTSNHNRLQSITHRGKLSYIVFLHQTTTPYYRACKNQILSYIVFLHQTTTVRAWYVWILFIVLYRLSTSNHNRKPFSLILR